MTTRSHDINGTPGSLAGDLSVPLARRSGQIAEIIPFPTPLPPPWLGDAGEPMDLDDDVYPIGFLAVKLTASWSLPRLQVLVQVQDGEEHPGPA